MNVPIKKKLQTQITIEFQAGTSIWLDMCERYVSASALRAHQPPLCAVSLCFTAVMQKAHRDAISRTQFCKIKNNQAQFFFICVKEIFSVQYEY